MEYFSRYLMYKELYLSLKSNSTQLNTLLTATSDKTSGYINNICNIKDLNINFYNAKGEKDNIYNIQKSNNECYNTNDKELTKWEFISKDVPTKGNGVGIHINWQDYNQIRLIITFYSSLEIALCLVTHESISKIQNYIIIDGLNLQGEKDIFIQYCKRNPCFLIIYVTSSNGDSSIKDSLKKLPNHVIFYECNRCITPTCLLNTQNPNCSREECHKSVIDDGFIALLTLVCANLGKNVQILSNDTDTLNIYDLCLCEHMTDATIQKTKKITFKQNNLSIVSAVILWNHFKSSNNETRVQLFKVTTKKHIKQYTIYPFYGPWFDGKNIQFKTINSIDDIKPFMKQLNEDSIKATILKKPYGDVIDNEEALKTYIDGMLQTMS